MYIEKVDEERAQSNLGYIQKRGYNFDGFNELVVLMHPKELAESFTEMYFEISQMLTIIHKDEMSIMDENWCNWLFELKELINSLKYMDKYNLHNPSEE